MKTPINEAIKEFLRVLALGVLPVVILSLENGLAVRETILITLIATLRAIEKFLHEENKHVKANLPQLPF